eukprot:m.1269886 g.1269886  ORF g.1269886 m.1269886 type:complete len:55 (+) comp24748_c0_seq9:998-1162(+)
MTHVHVDTHVADDVGPGLCTMMFMLTACESHDYAHRVSFITIAARVVVETCCLR